MSVDENGYSHEVVTDEEGRVWLKPTVTQVVLLPPAMTTTEAATALKKAIKDSRKEMF